MLLAGFDVYTGHFEILAIVIVGVAGDLVGASIAYAIGYFGRIEIAPPPRRARSTSRPSGSSAPSAGSRATATIAVPVCRILPLVRAYMSFPAGAARMRYGRFLALSALGGVPWIVFWGVLGRALGSNYHSVAEQPPLRRHRRASSLIVGGIVVPDRATPAPEDARGLSGARPRDGAAPGARRARAAARPGRARAGLLLGAHDARRRGCAAGAATSSTRRRASASRSRCTPARRRLAARRARERGRLRRAAPRVVVLACAPAGARRRAAASGRSSAASARRRRSRPVCAAGGAAMALAERARGGRERAAPTPASPTASRSAARRRSR